MLNLVRNAIDAMDSITARARVLRVRTERDGREAIVVSVEDSGPGIDPEKSDSIFDAFVTTKPQGMGLGLAICRMIISRHEGQLSVSADNKSGALFRFTLPINRRWALRQRRFKHGCARLSAPAEEGIEWASLCRLLAQRYRRRGPDFMGGISGTADIHTRVPSANQVEYCPNRTRFGTVRQRRR